MARDTQTKQDIARAVFSLLSDINRLSAFIRQDKLLVQAERDDLELAHRTLGKLLVDLK